MSFTINVNGEEAWSLSDDEMDSRLVSKIVVTSNNGVNEIPVVFEQDSVNITLEFRSATDAEWLRAQESELIAEQDAKQAAYNEKTREPEELPAAKEEKEEKEKVTASAKK